MSDPTLAEHADRLAIHELLYRYARMVDFREWALFDQVFASDAVCDYRSSGGIQGKARDVMDWLDRALAPWPTNLHFVTNVSIDFDPQRVQLRRRPVISSGRWRGGRWARTRS
jgi:hypothetical protein